MQDRLREHKKYFTATRDLLDLEMTAFKKAWKKIQDARGDHPEKQIPADMVMRLIDRAHDVILQAQELEGDIPQMVELLSMTKELLNSLYNTLPDIRVLRSEIP